jgi:hypothetical protein
MFDKIKVLIIIQFFLFVNNLPKGQVPPHSQSEVKTHRRGVENLRDVDVDQHKNSPMIRKIQTFW